MSTHHPSYTLTNSLDDSKRKMPGAVFKHQGTYFTTYFPRFGGVTETQKAALRWAWGVNTPPVVSVSHDKPISSTEDRWSNPEDLHQTYYSYATCLASLECLGEKAPRIVRVYFCNIVYHVDQGDKKIHTEHKGVRVVPIVPVAS